MNGHPARLENFDLYALGVLEGDERAAIESHVPTCASCAPKLAEARGRIALLAFSAPHLEPSPAVKERLMHQIHSSPQATGAQRAPRKPERAASFFGRWWAAVLVPLGVALTIAAIFLWTENARLSRELAQQRDAMRRQERQLDEALHAKALLESKDTIHVSLASQPGMPKGDVRVMYNAKMGMAMCDGWVEPAPANKSYQLWLVPMEGKPISAGLISSSTGPINPWTIRVPQGVAAKAFAVTLEPAGGMPQPTGPMVLVGPVT